MDKRLELTKEQKEAVNQFEDAYRAMLETDVLIGIELGSDGLLENLLFMNNKSIRGIDFVSREKAEEENYSEANDVGMAEDDVLYVPSYDDVQKMEFGVGFRVDVEDWIGIALANTKEVRNFIERRGKTIELLTLKKELEALEKEANARKTAIKQLESELGNMDKEDLPIEILNENADKVKLSVRIGRDEKPDLLHKVLKDERKYTPDFIKKVGSMLDAVDMLERVKNIYAKDNYRVSELRNKAFTIYRDALLQLDDETSLTTEQHDMIRNELVKMKDIILN